MPLATGSTRRTSLLSVGNTESKALRRGPDRSHTVLASIRVEVHNEWLNVSYLKKKYNKCFRVICTKLLQ